MASILLNKPRIMIVPGNGCTNVRNSNWYGWLADQLESLGLFSQVILQNMPDPYVAREKHWIPFIRKCLVGDRPEDDPELNNTILIGHSSGAEAAMRYLEKYPLVGCVLVSACHTDLGSDNERESGYYDHPWEWSQIKHNAKWIIQYHSLDDPFIPISEADFVAKSIDSEYVRLADKSHFFEPEDIISLIPKLKSKFLD